MLALAVAGVMFALTAGAAFACGYGEPGCDYITLNDRR